MYRAHMLYGGIYWCAYDCDLKSLPSNHEWYELVSKSRLSVSRTSLLVFYGRRYLLKKVSKKGYGFFRNGFPYTFHTVYQKIQKSKSKKIKKIKRVGSNVRSLIQFRMTGLSFP